VPATRSSGTTLTEPAASLCANALKRGILPFLVCGTVSAASGIMTRRVWNWVVVGAGWSALIAGCGGSAQDHATGGAGSANHAMGAENNGTDPIQEPAAPSHAGAGNSSGANSPAGDGGAGSGEGGSGQSRCTGELSKVAAEWWLECPATYCAALAWAQGCHSIPNHPTARAGSCQDLQVVTLSFGTHSKECYYSHGFAFAPPKLVGAAATNDTPSYCENTAFRIEAGSTATCAPEIVCDGSREEPAPDPDAPPPPACFNSFSSTCEPCCSDTPPECTGKPNGYPGYGCTPEDNSFCSCSCTSEMWTCPC